MPSKGRRASDKPRDVVCDGCEEGLVAQSGQTTEGS